MMGWAIIVGLLALMAELFLCERAHLGLPAIRINMDFKGH